MYRSSSLYLLISSQLFLVGWRNLESSAQELRNTRLVIESVKIPADSGSFISHYGLTRDDLRQITQSVPGIEFSIPVRTVPIMVRYRTQETAAEIHGTTADYKKLIDSENLTGRFLEEKDVVQRNNVAVIGAGVARKLFGPRSSDIIGRNMKIGSNYFLIVGFLKKNATLSENQDRTNLDDAVWIPLTTMKSRMGDDSIMISKGAFEAVSYELSRVELVLKDSSKSPLIKRLIQRILESNHEKQDYRLRIVD